MELRHLRYFITVAEELSFSKAALKLHTAQPSLSQQIKDLEDDIGVQLFHRTKRKVELTEEGLVFLEQARLTLTQADKAITMARQVAAAKVQYLKIGFVPSAEIRIFPYILPRLRVKLPKLQIRTLNLKESDQIAELKKGDLDIQAVHSGQSCAILPSYMQALATDQIVMRRLSHSLPCLDVFFSYNRLEPSLATEQFLEQIRQVFELDIPA